ncbi:MAG TPA: hypothetical protein VGR92_23015 [Steroidobacteraceae bacterium]|nr:hypothetical protein [Steroidobacteraceae bacterium]
MNEKSSYTPAPEVPPEVMPRLVAVVEVLAGLKTVSEAARSLDLSRNHFQTILHRGVLGLVQSITVKPGGRPANAPELTALHRQLKKLERENARLKKRVDSTDRLLEVAGGLLHGRIRPTGRQRRTRKSSTGSNRHEDSDPEAQRQHILAGVEQMRRLGLTAEIAASIAGLDASTLRRWRMRTSQSVLRQRPAHRLGMFIPTTAAKRAETLVRSLHGLIGAEAIHRSVAELSRRAAAHVKAQTLIAMERERKAALVQVRITQPGVLRGMDAMYGRSAEGRFYALIGADGSIPYRTSVVAAARYDTPLVAHALRVDFETHGAPLVMRMDRASVHDAPQIDRLLEEYGVLLLHGPPRYPGYYGQLERQNRDHRVLFGALMSLPSAQIPSCLREMLEAVNTLWRRRSLQWHTAAELWNARPRPLVDRVAFRQEVHEHELRLARILTHRGTTADLAGRLAIEQTLTRWGYLRQKMGGWC